MMSSVYPEVVVDLTCDACSHDVELTFDLVIGGALVTE